jgi:hypothetical protein
MDDFWLFHLKNFLNFYSFVLKKFILVLSGLTIKALQWPNFGHCCFGQVHVIRRCDIIFGEFYGK